VIGINTKIKTLLLVSHPTFQKVVKIRRQHSELTCWQTDGQRQKTSYAWLR